MSRSEVMGAKWIGNLPLPDLLLLVHPHGGPRYRMALRNALADVGPSHRDGDGNPSIPAADTAEGKALASLLADWRGLTSDGQPVPFLPERAQRLLTDPEYRPLREAVAYAASSLADEEQARLGRALKLLTDALRWQLEWSSEAGRLTKCFEDAGLPVPEHIRAPELPGELSDYFVAFVEVSTDRPAGMVVMPIPSMAIDAYARRYGYDDPDDFDRFRKIIRAMDAVYLDKYAPPPDAPPPGE